jgi:hypothetical protein
VADYLNEVLRFVRELSSISKAGLMLGVLVGTWAVGGVVLHLTGVSNPECDSPCGSTFGWVFLFVWLFVLVVELVGLVAYVAWCLLRR